MSEKNRKQVNIRMETAAAVSLLVTDILVKICCTYCDGQQASAKNPEGHLV